jgi:DNA polymerase elongation subunit (family B)
LCHLCLPLSRVLNASTFKREDIITTREGKSFISQYLTANAKDINIESKLVLDIDSELNIQSVPCQHGQECQILDVDKYHSLLANYLIVNIDG